MRRTANMAVAGAGLVKPITITQRGRHAASHKTRNPTINTNASTDRGDVICSSTQNDSLFISSYHDEKRHKYRQHLRERAKKWLVGTLTLTVVFALAVGSWPSSSNEASVQSGKQRNEISAKARGTKSSPPGMEALTNANPVNRFRIEPDGEKEADGGVKVHVAKGEDDVICGRKIPFSLSDTSLWPTPFVSTLSERSVAPHRPRAEKEVILLKKDELFGNLGSQLNSLFHAYDLAYDTGGLLYITQNSWVFDALFPIFLGPFSAVEQNAKLWATIQETLGAKIVENEGVLTLMGRKVHEHTTLEDLNHYSSSNLNPTKIRNHRSTILRKLFRYPSHHGTENVCSAFESLHGTDKEKKYTTIHMAAPSQKSYLSKFNENTGKDHSAASVMDPDYVMALLEQLDMQRHDIYLIDGGGEVDNVAHKKLENAAKSDLLKIVDLPLQFKNVGSYVYLAVLADVYLGNPVDQTSLWIARMRYALGIRNTYIFTEKEGGKWVSYLDDDSYLDLYDVKKLGIPWMG